MGGEWRRNIEQRLDDLEVTQRKHDTAWLGLSKFRTDTGVHVAAINTDLVKHDTRIRALEQALATNPPPEPTGLTPELRAKVEEFIRKARYLPEPQWGRPNLNEPVLTIPDVWVLVDMLVNR